MTREEVLDALRERLGAARYLEIGLGSGSPIMRLDVPRKFGVDPVLPRWKRRLQCHLRDLRRGRRTRFFRMTSDAFFARHAGLLGAAPLDLAFVDGLHSAEQAYADVLACLRHLAPGGVLVMHDCNPPSAAAAAPQPELVGQVSGDWYGDVWKAVVRLRASRADLQVFVLDCDCGLGIVRRGTSAGLSPVAPEQVEGLTYADLAADRTRLLDLRPPERLSAFLATLPPLAG